MTAIEDAIASIGAKDRVKKLALEEEKILRERLRSEFTSGRNRRFWWECFSKPEATVCPSSGAGHELIGRLVPDPNEPCWFMIEDFDSDSFPIYEATPELAVKVLGNLPGLEYYLVPKDMRWLLCENHHGVVIGVGAEVIRAINCAAA